MTVVVKHLSTHTHKYLSLFMTLTIFNNVKNFNCILWIYVKCIPSSVRITGQLWG